ncbi:MAG TPA: IPT/TIG domain-containing protein [Kofleriaceae bacterium]|jgi:uncharacterized protein (TIGR03437 family)
MRIALAYLLCALAACTANDDMPAPRLSSIVPSHAAPGTSVTVFGDHLCQQPDMAGSDDQDPLACANTGLVDFDRVPGSVESYTDTSVAAVVPDLPAGKVDVVVAVLGRSSNGVELVIETNAP